MLEKRQVDEGKSYYLQISITYKQNFEAAQLIKYMV